MNQFPEGIISIVTPVYHTEGMIKEPIERIQKRGNNNLVIY